MGMLECSCASLEQSAASGLSLNRMLISVGGKILNKRESITLKVSVAKGMKDL